MAFNFPRRSLALIAAALVSVGALAACGHGPMGRGGDDAGMAMMMGGPDGPRGHGPRSEADMQKMRERMVERATKELALDEAQKQRLVKLMDTLQAQRQALMGQPGQGPRQDLQALMAGDKFDRSKAQALADAKAQTIRTGSPELIAAAGDFFDSLKPEQQAKVRAFMARGGRAGHHGMRGGPQG